jgi:hypothetical protein
VSFRTALYHCQTEEKLGVFICGNATNVCGAIKYAGLITVVAITVLSSNFMEKKIIFEKLRIF